MRTWLRTRRKEAGLTQKDVAVLVGVSNQFFNYVENGTRRPSPEVAKQIASILGFDWTLFFEEGGGLIGRAEDSTASGE